MSDITINLDDDIARWAHDWSTQHDVSLSRMVGDLLRQQMDEEATQYESALRRYATRAPVPLKGEGAYPTREDLHERGVLR